MVKAIQKARIQIGIIGRKMPVVDFTEQLRDN